MLKLSITFSRHINQLKRKKSKENLPEVGFETNDLWVTALYHLSYPALWWGRSLLTNIFAIGAILCLIPRTTVTSLSPALGYTLQDASFMHQSRCYFLNAWENTQVTRAMKSAFPLNPRWRHGSSPGETKYSQKPYNLACCVIEDHTQFHCYNPESDTEGI